MRLTVSPEFHCWPPAQGILAGSTVTKTREAKNGAMTESNRIFEADKMDQASDLQLLYVQSGTSANRNWEKQTSGVHPVG